MYSRSQIILALNIIDADILLGSWNKQKQKKYTDS
jgi:hypothetical protein